MGNNLSKFPGIVLASQSPRRREILAAHGITDPIIQPADVNEDIPAGLNPYEVTMYLSLKKALHIAETHPEHQGKLIIASDTVVSKDQILGKPADKAEATSMIEAIAGTSHEVVTGVTLLVAGENKTRCFYDITKVFVQDMTAEEIQAYVSTDEPYDKAGAYAIQGEFGKYITHYEGDYENVVGLPFQRLEAEAGKL